MNQSEHLKEPKVSDYFKDPKFTNEPLLEEGTKVHVRLQQPIDHTVDNKKIRLHGGFRAGDLRWEKQPTTIKNVIIVPNQPVRYITEKYNNVSFLRKELLLVSDYVPDEEPKQITTKPKPKPKTKTKATTPKTKTTPTKTNPTTTKNETNKKYPNMATE